MHIVHLSIELSLVATLCLRSEAKLEVEIVFLRKQLAMLLERKQRPRRATRMDRVVLVLLAKLVTWRELLVVVRPETLLRWHREILRLDWWLRSRRCGRPPLPPETIDLIRRLARENPSWGARHIRDHLRIKFGLRVATATVRKYWPPELRPGPRRPRGDQRWATFVRNHAQAIVACDFAVVRTLGGTILYVFVAMEIASRRILHTNVTAHPTALWTTQQVREIFVPDHRYSYLLHDRDAIFSAELDATMQRFGVRVLKSPPRCPTANSYVERIIGTLRRECLDWIIPLGENHLRFVVREWAAYYNRGRPHSSLGPGLPDPPEDLPVALQLHRHRLPAGSRITATPILGGLHHDYRLVA